MSATWARGRLVVSRAFPSFSRMRIVPVSATAKLTPEIPRSASAKRRRNACRAAAASVVTSSEGAIPSFSANSAAIWALVLWMAGTTMCDGVSPASWTMYSPKSVSTGSMPRRARCGRRARRSWPRRQHFRDVQGADRRSPARQPAGDLHQTAHVAGHHGVHTGPLDDVHLLVEYGDGDLGVLHRKRSTEAAARL